MKILEAQNIKLRLTRRTSQDGASVAAAPAAAGSSRQPSAAEPSGLTPQGSGEGLEGGSSGPGENRQPNAVEDGAGGEGAGPQLGGREASVARTHSFLEGNPVLEKWEADKRLQKRVEALQAKLKVCGGGVWGEGGASAVGTCAIHGCMGRTVLRSCRSICCIRITEFASLHC